MKIKLGITLLILFLVVTANAQNSLSGRWQLVSMTDEKGQEITLPEETKITAEFRKDTFSAEICNSIGGSYKTAGSKITFSKILSTMKACREMETERVFSQALARSRSFSLKKNVLTLWNRQKKSLLRFEKMGGKDSVSLTGKWKLVSLKAGKDFPLSAKPITLNIEKDKIGGSGGCNVYGGNFSQAANKISFSNIISTQMWCEDSSPAENQYFRVLEKSVIYEFKNGQLILMDAKKENLLVFEKN